MLLQALRPVLAQQRKTWRSGSPGCGSDRQYLLQQIGGHVGANRGSTDPVQQHEAQLAALRLLVHCHQLEQAPWREPYRMETYVSRELVATLVAQRTEIDERMEKREERLRADCERRVEAANAALERLRLDYERRLADARAHEERPQTGRSPPSGADGAAPRAKAGAAADTLKATYEEELGIQKAEYEDELEAQKTDYEAKLRAQQVDYQEKLRAQQVEYEAKLAARQPDDGERSIDLSEIQGP